MGGFGCASGDTINHTISRSAVAVVAVAGVVVVVNGSDGVVDDAVAIVMARYLM